MVAAIPTLNALWRPNGDDATKDDRELIRAYSEQPAVAVVLHDLTVNMNRMADVSPVAVAQIQTWIDEVEALEAQWAGSVADGSASILQAAEYEGPINGTPLTRDDQLKRADVLEWDTQANRVRILNGNGGTATQANAIGGRIAQLKGRILKAMNLSPMTGARLLRS
jgi:hypothetical protein